MSGPIKHNTTGLWVEKKNTAQRAEQRSGLVLNIHVVGGLNDCCLRELWAMAKQFVWQETAEKVRGFFFHLIFLNSFLSLTISKCQCHGPTMGRGSVCPQVTLKKPNFNSFFIPSFFPVSKFWQKKKFSLQSGAQQNGKQTEPFLHWREHTSAF